MTSTPTGIRKVVLDSRASEVCERTQVYST